MASVRSRVRIDPRFREVGRAWEREIANGLHDAAVVGARVSEEQAGRRRRSGRMADIQVERPKRSRVGNWYVVFFSPAWYWRFHEWGTRHIRPLRFLSKGRTAARKVLLAAIALRMSRVR